LLTRHLLDEICRTNGFEPREVDPSLLSAFARYEWPGNIRELKNALESLVILTGKRTLAAEDLPAKFFNDSAPLAEEGNPEPDEPGFNLVKLSKQTIL